MKRRVLYVIANDSFGGGERVFAQLISRLDRRRFEPAAAAAPGGPFEEAVRSSGAPFFPAAFTSRLSWGGWRGLRAALKAFQPDIVHSQGKRADLHAALAVRRPASLVATVTTPIEEYPVSRPVRGAYTVVDRWLERRFDLVLTVCDHLRRTLVEGHGLPAEKVTRVYNGVDPGAFAALRTGREEARASLGLAPDEGAVVCVGRLSVEKGQDILLEAARVVLTAAPRTRFLLAGDGPRRPVLEEQARRLGLGERVRFLGFVKDPERVLWAADCVALPSRREGFPMVLLEALGLERAVAAADIYGVREAIQDGETALLVTPEDPSALAHALLRLLQDKDLAARLGRAGRRAVEEGFTLDTMLRETMKAYEGLP